jgi:hypothetical protein
LLEEDRQGIMTLALPPIQSLWIGRPLSTIERLCINSFLQNGHPFHLYIYQSVQNVPEGVILKDANEILSSDLIYQSPDGWGKGSYAPFADLFRLELLRQRGGWWVDMDVICLQPVTFPTPNIVATSLEWQYGVLPNSNVLRFEPGHPFLEHAIRLYKASKIEYLIGVKAVQQTAEDFADPALLAPPEAFNPISWRYVKYITGVEEGPWHPRRIKRMLGITPPVGRITPNSWMLHLWNEVWTQSGLDREATYHPDSIFERLKQRYGP